MFGISACSLVMTELCLPIITFAPSAPKTIKFSMYGTPYRTKQAVIFPYKSAAVASWRGNNVRNLSFIVKREKFGDTCLIH